MKEFIQDSAVIKAGLWVGKTFSLPALRRLAKFVAKIIASRQSSSMVRSIKANQWVISGESMNKEELQQRTVRVITAQLISLAEYFYYYQHPQEGADLIRLTPEAEKAFADIRDHKVPTFILGPHIGNYDFFMMALSWLKIPLYVLAYPNPNNAYKEQNKLRAAVGLQIYPISFSSFRGAKQALKEGYALATGIDRPLDNPEDAKYKPIFFGRPAALPIFYSRLCLDTGAIARVACGYRQEDGTFVIDTSGPIVMEARYDLVEENLINAEKVLKPTEEFILRSPAEWAMFYPVWPEVIPLIDHLL
ncbi:MAG: hypothetical protein PHW11_03390 [Anaerolineaceae bacterium]|nr:hypothetical protein [Anaerolineaceae bacterium]MDD4577853.1 hypothetical protein [Anaerolineaceae bacterium]